MKRFPYDSSGSSPNNVFVETREVLSNDNTDRVIILNHAPFFPDLTITVGESTTPLRRGVDYELTYQLTALEGAVKGEIYCGVQIMSPLVAGPLKFQGQTLGGDFVDPLTEILDELVKYLNSPLKGSWDDVQNRPALYPREQSYRSWADFLNTQYIADAVNDLENSIVGGSNNEAAAIAALRANIMALSTTIDEFDYPGHIADTNPHTTTVQQLTAHPKGLAVADTMMAYGKDFLDLTDYIRANGLTEEDINQYINRYPSGNTYGTFEMKDGLATIWSEDHTSKITMNAGRMHVMSKGSVILQADYDINGGDAEFSSFISGENELKIVTDGSTQDSGKIYLNGDEILNVRSIKRYQSNGEGGGSATTEVVTSSTSITFTGKGTPDDPLSGTLRYNNATQNGEGVVRLKDTDGTETDGWAATPKALKPLRDQLQTLVPNTRMINDHPMTGHITLTKGDIRLGDVDNTSDLEKPLSSNLTQEVSRLNDGSHKHEWSELGISNASVGSEGITKIANNVDAIPDGCAVEPKVLNDIKIRIESLIPRYANTMIATDVEFATVSDSEFTISGFKLVPSSPIEYTISKDNALMNGSFDGEVDLSQTPDDGWEHPANDCDLRWGKAQLHPTDQPTLDVPSALAIAPLTLWTTVGSFAVKKRVNFKNDSIRIRFRPNDSAEVFVDGVSYGIHDSAAIREVTVQIQPGRHTIGIKLTNWGGGGNIKFGIYDGPELVEVSDESWPCSELGQLVDATNNRFYLYGSVVDGTIIARPAPRNWGAVSTDLVFIGVVKTDFGKALPNSDTKLAYRSTIDYGTFNELEEHLSEEGAHGGDVQPEIVGLENVQGYGEAGGSAIMDVPVQFAVGGIILGFHKIEKSGVLTRVESAGMPYRLVQMLQGHCPAQWATVTNPLEGGRYTVEGILHARYGHDSDDAPKFIFVAPPVNGISSVLEISFDESPHYNNNVSFSTYNINTVEESVEVVTMDAAISILDVTADMGAGVATTREGAAYSAGKYNSQDTGCKFMGMRYRYVPETNKLTLLVNAGTETLIQDFTPSFNLSAYMTSGVLGITGDRGRVTFGGVLDGIGYELADLRRVTYHRGLLECYLSGNDVNKYAIANNGQSVMLQDHDLDSRGSLAVAESWHGATDFTFLATESREYKTTTDQPLPALLMGHNDLTYLDWPLAVVDTSRAPDTSHTHATAKNISPFVGWGFFSPRTCIFKKRIQTTKANGFLKIRLEGDDECQATINDWESGVVAFNTKSTRVAAVKAGFQDIEIKLTNAGGYAGVAFAIYEGDTNSQDVTNDTLLDVSDTSWHVLETSAPHTVLLHTNPWHTCQKAWERTLDLIAQE